MAEKSLNRELFLFPTLKIFVELNYLTKKCFNLKECGLLRHKRWNEGKTILANI